MNPRFVVALSAAVFVSGCAATAHHHASVVKPVTTTMAPTRAPRMPEPLVPSVSTTQTSAARRQSGPYAVAPAPADIPACTTNQLKIGAVGTNGGADHGGEILEFHNVGPTCVIQGYPGVDGVEQNGTHVWSAKRTPSGYLGGVTGVPPRVVLAPLAYASALLEG